jgi:hypothetical protein
MASMPQTNSVAANATDIPAPRLDERPPACSAQAHPGTLAQATVHLTWRGCFRVSVYGAASG